MDKIKHLKNKYSLARYELLRVCDGNELRFYLYLKLYAINKHEAFPSFSIIKKDLGWDNKKISRIIKKMVKIGRLRVGRKIKKTKSGKQSVNIYDITWYDRVNNSGRGSGKMEQGSGKLELPFHEQGSGKMTPEPLSNYKKRTNKEDKIFIPGTGEVRDFTSYRQK